MSPAIPVDKMTPLERRDAYFRHLPYDRIPCNPSIGDHAATVLGVSVAEYHQLPQIMARAQVAAYRLYGHDAVGVGPGSTGIAEAVGSKVRFPEQSTPLIWQNVIQRKTDLDNLTIPDPHTGGRFGIFLEALEILKETVGQEVPVSLTLGGPVSTAGGLIGTETLLRVFRKDPEFAHRLLRFALDATLPFVREVARLGVSFGIVDPVSSGSLLSPAFYTEFAQPYQTELIREIKGLGSSAMLHICGDTSKNWVQMAGTGANVLSLDNRVDLAEAKREVGDIVALAGNVNPYDSMFLGKPKDVEADALSCIRKGFDCKAGYVLAMGCGLPIPTPQENVHALMNAARKHGRYPLVPV